AATAGTQSIHAGGVLTVDGAIIKQNEGDIDLQSLGALTVASVDTAHLGNGITIDGHESVKTGALTSKVLVSLNAANQPETGGNVRVHSSGNIDVASIDSSGAAGRASTPSADATAGSAAGSVWVSIVNPIDSSSTIAIGKVNASGGAGGSPSTDRPTGT